MPTLDVRQAAQLLNDGKVIAYPTEAVFGLGCDPNADGALREILALKGREQAQGFIVLIRRLEQLDQWLTPDTMQALSERPPVHWPGAVTYLLPCREDTPRLLRGMHQTLAVRMPSMPLLLELLDAMAMPLVSTSANKHGQAPARSAIDVAQSFGAQLPILAGELGGAERPSTIIDWQTNQVLRA